VPGLLVFSDLIVPIFFSAHFSLLGHSLFSLLRRFPRSDFPSPISALLRLAFSPRVLVLLTLFAKFGKPGAFPHTNDIPVAAKQRLRLRAGAPSGSRIFFRWFMRSRSACCGSFTARMLFFLPFSSSFFADVPGSPNRRSRRLPKKLQEARVNF